MTMTSTTGTMLFGPNGDMYTNGGNYSAVGGDIYTMDALSVVLTGGGNYLLHPSGSTVTITGIDTSYGPLAGGGTVNINASQINDAGNAYYPVTEPLSYDIWVGSRDNAYIASRITMQSAGISSAVWPNGLLYRGAIWPGIGDTGPLWGLEIFFDPTVGPPVEPPEPKDGFNFERFLRMYRPRVCIRVRKMRRDEARDEEEEKKRKKKQAEEEESEEA